MSSSSIWLNIRISTHHLMFDGCDSNVIWPINDLLISTQHLQATWWLPRSHALHVSTTKHLALQSLTVNTSSFVCMRHCASTFASLLHHFKRNAPSRRRTKELLKMIFFFPLVLGWKRADWEMKTWRALFHRASFPLSFSPEGLGVSCNSSVRFSLAYPVTCSPSRLFMGTFHVTPLQRWQKDSHFVLK